jgi:hypothetical protein
MKTKTYKVYKFNELSKKTKQRALVTYRDINVNDN